ncbi:MAG: hypothetical protein U0694_18775 [Anaerolineae bacterium]
MTTRNSSETRRSVYAVLIALMSLLLGGLGAFVFTSDAETIRLAADTTIQRFVVLTFYISLAMSLIGYRLLADEQQSSTDVERLEDRLSRRDLIGRLTVSFAVAWILSAACQAVFLLLIGKVFPEAALPRFIMMALFALYSALLGFGVAFFIVRVDDLELTRLLAILGVGGILFSATLVTTPEWWQRSVSALGIDPGSSTFFNVTVIVIGLISLTLGRDVAADLKLLTRINLFPPRGYDILRFGITGTCLGIIGVGLFPTEGSAFSHNLHLFSAYTMAVLYIAGMLLLEVIAPNIYPKSFVYIARGFGVLCIVLFVANLAKVLAFVPMELLLFAAFGLWIFAFRYETKQYVRKTALPTALAAASAAN